MRFSVWRALSPAISILVLASNLGIGGVLGAGNAAHFLRDGLGARARGMGGAFVAAADDVTACFWNPAGLARLLGTRLGGAYESRYAGLSSLQYLCGTAGSPTAGAGVLWVHSDLYSVYSLSAAALLDGFSLGLTAKLYDFSASGQRARGFGLDIGALYELPLGESKLVLGFTSSDVGWTVIRWHGAGIDAVDHVAWVSRLGAAVSAQADYGQWLGTADLELALRRPPLPGEEGYLSKALQFALRVGVELRLEAIALRAGLNGVSFGVTEGLSAHPSLGVGLYVKGLTFDVAWTSSPLGATYLLSVEFQL